MDTFMQFWHSFSSVILEILPDSPTIDSDVLASLAEYAGYINYWVPVGPYLTFFSALLSCVAVYYLAVVILRCLKLVY